MLAHAELEVRVLQRMHAAIMLGQPFGAQNDVRHGSAPYCLAALPPLIQNHGAHDDHALHHLLVIGIELQEGEA